MTEISYILIPILITDVINPVLLAAVIFGLGSPRPYLNGWLILFGWFITYFVSGIIFALGLESIIAYLNDPKPFVFIIELIVGLVLFGVGFWMTKGDNKKGKKKEYGDSADLKPWTTFIIGASINLIGMPFAVPYFAALDQILKADFNTVQAVSVLLIYNLFYILPFAIIIIIRLLFRKDGDAILQKVNDLMEKIGAFLMPLMMFLIGGALVADAAAYFVRGVPLF